MSALAWSQTQHALHGAVVPAGHQQRQEVRDVGTVGFRVAGMNEVLKVLAMQRLLIMQTELRCRRGMRGWRESVETCSADDVETNLRG